MRVGRGRALRRPQTFTTVLGPLRLERAWYHCDACHTGFAPRDRALGMEATTLSPGAMRMAGIAASASSFAEASGLLQELAGLEIDSKSVERHAEALGAEIAQDERHADEVETPKAPTLYLGLDGTGVPMRSSETQGRAGKQPDGKARTREAKLCVVWSAESRDRDGAPIRDADSASYNAAIESAATRDTDPDPSPFALRVLREAHRRGFHLAPRQVILGDGAPWIWNLADEHFPNAIQLVDIFHAKQHLSDTARAIYGPLSDLVPAWARQRHVELDHGRIDRILAALNGYANSSHDARKCRDYFSRNRLRMQYPAFRNLGLSIASGVVEGACNVPGANAILQRHPRTPRQYPLQSLR